MPTSARTVMTEVDCCVWPMENVHSFTTLPSRCALYWPVCRSVRVCAYVSSVAVNRALRISEQQSEWASERASKSGTVAAANFLISNQCSFVCMPAACLLTSLLEMIYPVDIWFALPLSVCLLSLLTEKYFSHVIKKSPKPT